MKKENAKSDYRKIFMDYYRIPRLSSKYVIHHIDKNRDNNNIENLLLLPMNLHSKYHSVSNLPDINVSRITNSTVLAWKSSLFENLFDTLQECSKWVDYKEYLAGTMPNIHNIILED
jgi:hypothetical protein